jgi:hypothetical protein
MRIDELALAFRRGDRFDRDCLTAVVPATRGADVVRAMELVAMLALDERRCADREVRSAFALARLGNLSLGNAHAETP